MAEVKHLDKVNASAAGIRTIVSDDDVTVTTPTEAEIITAFGTAAAVGSGFIGIIDDAGADTTGYLVFSDGTSYWFLTGTLAA